MKRQLWVDGNFTTQGSSGAVPNIPPIVEQLYTYDNASNRTGAFDARPGAGLPLSHRYEYDGLHRLTEARRGVWNSSEDPDLADATHTLNSQQWELDLLGNWDTVSTEDGGNGAFDPAELESRLHNDVNKLLDRTMPGGSPTLDLSWDAAGNIEVEESGDGTTSLVYTHDAWDRLVKIEFDDGAQVHPRAEYEFNGLNWRTVKRADIDPTDGTHQLSQQRTMYYSASWQLLEERVDDEAPFAAGPDDGDIDRHVQYMWGPRYIDDIILHREHDGAGGGEDRWYHLTDVQFSTVAILDESAAVAERVTYTAYGRARHHWPADVDGDGDHDATDQNIIGSLRREDIDDPGYEAAADLNRDGTIDNADWTLASGSNPALAEGVLSDASAGAPDNQIGYVFSVEGAFYSARLRCYCPSLGRWLERDPVGYVDGLNLHEFVRAIPRTLLDPYGDISLGAIKAKVRNCANTLLERILELGFFGTKQCYNFPLPVPSPIPGTQIFATVCGRVDVMGCCKNGIFKTCAVIDVTAEVGLGAVGTVSIGRHPVGGPPGSGAVPPPKELDEAAEPKAVEEASIRARQVVTSSSPAWSKGRLSRGGLARTDLCYRVRRLEIMVGRCPGLHLYPRWEVAMASAHGDWVGYKRDGGWGHHDHQVLVMRSCAFLSPYHLQF